MAENLSGKTAVQSVQPVWDLLEIVVQKDASREEDVSDFRSPSPAATKHSAAQIGAESPRDMVAEDEVDLCEGEYEWWSENEGHVPPTKNTTAPESSSEAPGQYA